MAVTYKTAADRDAPDDCTGGEPAADRRSARIAARWRLHLGGLLVLAAYVGVVRVPRSEPPDVAPLNLNGAVARNDSTRSSNAAFPLPADRRLAAQQLFAFLEKLTAAVDHSPMSARSPEHAFPWRSLNAVPRQRRFGSGSSRSASARDPSDAKLRRQCRS